MLRPSYCRPRATDSSAKLREAPVVTPIRLLQETTMMELFQEQLRSPSLVERISWSAHSDSSRLQPLQPAPPSHRHTISVVSMAPSAAAQPPATVTVLSTAPPPSSTSTAILASAPPSAVGAGFDTAQMRECQICFEKMDALQAHVCVMCAGSFCASCTRWYIEYKVLEGEVSQRKLVCPAPLCTRPLPEELVEAYVSPDTFEKYKMFLKNQKTGIRFCPRAGCCAVLEEPLFSTHRRVKCTACNEESCMRCGDEFHKVPLCRKVEKRFDKWKKNHNVRACPSCKTNIEKHGGCCHMKCFQCDQEFCWSCLRDWQSHDETLCVPLAFLHSKSRKFGCWAPMRAVTKTAVASVATVVLIAGAGVAVVVVPPLVAFNYAKDHYRSKRYPPHSFAVQNALLTE